MMLVKGKLYVTRHVEDLINKNAVNNPASQKLTIFYLSVLLTCFLYH